MDMCLGIEKKVITLAIHRMTFGSKEEWLKHRTKIGGSDASCILGLNPWKNNIELWMEKTGQATPNDISDKECVKYGVSAEPLLRELFALDFPEYEVEYFGDNMILNDDYPFAAASLDGELTEKATGRKGILEIKTTNILQSMQKEKWKGKLPDNYYVQCIHYLLVTGYSFVILKAQLKSEFNGEVYLQVKHYKIERADVEEDIKYLEDAEKRFWQQVQNKTRPALLLPSI